MLKVSRFSSVRRCLPVLVGAALVAGCVGPREGAAPSVGEVRTKNGVTNFLGAGWAKTFLVAAKNLTLTTKSASIGYPVRLTFNGIDPAFDVEYGASGTGCSVDTLTGILTYVGTDKADCTVWATQLDAKKGGGGTVTFIPPVVSTTLSKDLVAYFPFNDSSSIGYNVVTKKSDLTAVGGVAFRSQGRFGGGVYLNGRDGQLQAASSSNTSGSISNLPAGNTPYAISAWMKPTEFARGSLVGWGKFDGKSASGTVLLRMNDNKMPASDEIAGGIVHVWWGADQVYTHTGTRVFVDNLGRTGCCVSSFTEGNWVHVAATYDGKTRTIYYGGKPVASDVPTAVNAVTNANFRIGGSMGGIGDFFAGKLDDVAVWKRALSAQEVSTLAASPVATPSPDLGASFVPFVPTPCEKQGGYCDVGDKAPDGGTVFYVGNFKDQLTGQEMRYLEAAPGDLTKAVNGPGTTALTGYETTCDGAVHPIPETNKWAIGEGRRNTLLITKFCKGGAAHRAMALSIGGSSDWFVPSADELKELCKFARNQITGDTNVDCASKYPLGGGWAQDKFHGYFLSSTQGKVVDQYVALFASTLASLGVDWLDIALVIGQKTGAFDSINWGGQQAWRIGYNFLDGSRADDNGNGSQVRPVRYLAPGAQAPFSVEPANGLVDEAVKFKTSGGSGDGPITYRVTDAGTAKCATTADRSVVVATNVGSCAVVASKAGSGSFRVVRTAPTSVTIEKGSQTPLTLGTPSIFVGDATAIIVNGGKGSGASSISIADAGATGCKVANPDAGSNQVVATVPGVCRITLDKAGSDNYQQASSVTVDVRVVKKDQAALSLEGGAGIIDGNVALTSSGGSGTGAITYSVVAGGTSDCRIAAGGAAVTAERPGTCIVKAAKAADANYLDAVSGTAEVKFAVNNCDEQGKRADGSDCKVGDVGPGGGRVFYVSDKPISYADGVSTGGTFLEVAPSGWSGSTSEYSNQWCRSGKVGVALKSGIGDGADNTFRVAMAGGCSPDSVMKKVADASIGGKDDWFVPSIKELNEVCKFAYRQASGNPAVNCAPNGAIRADFVGLAGPGFGTWSSTEVISGSYTQNYSMNLKTGPSNYDMSIQGTGTFMSVRPIRAFGASKPPTTVAPAGFGSTTVPPPTTSTLPIDWVCDNSGKRQDGSACQVGDTGPAGGRVIYLAGASLNAADGISKGGRYFELAPAGWSGTPKDPSMALGCTSGQTRTDLGLGAPSTKAMLDACPSGNGAVQTAANFSLTRNGVVYDDWFLPSRGEVKSWSDSKLANLGLEMGKNYWSSSFSSSSAGQAWMMSVSFEWLGAIAAAANPSTSLFVRPIRVFG